MAVSYISTIANNYIVLCLSSDTKPSAIAGAILLETDTGFSYKNSGGSWVVVVASQPDITLTLLQPTADQTITANYSAYCSGYYEIADTKILEIGSGSVFEIG